MAEFSGAGAIASVGSGGIHRVNSVASDEGRVPFVPVSVHLAVRLTVQFDKSSGDPEVLGAAGCYGGRTPV
jgi:hypothetical protein